MRRKHIILALLISTIFSISCNSQDLKVNKFLKEYKALDIKFVNHKIYNKSRKAAIAIRKETLKKADTLILVEYFNDITANYSCSIYNSNELICYDILTSFKDKKVKVVETNLCGITPHLINAFKSNTLEVFLEKGKNIRFTPNTKILITIALKENGEYHMKSYMTNNFKIE